jgi:hypothetical protein
MAVQPFCNSLRPMFDSSRASEAEMISEIKSTT